MGQNITSDENEETRLEFDEIEDYSFESWLIMIDEELHFFPKSLTRIYIKPKAFYAPNWLLAKKGLI